MDRIVYTEDTVAWAMLTHIEDERYSIRKAGGRFVATVSSEGSWKIQMVDDGHCLMTSEDSTQVLIPMSQLVIVNSSTPVPPGLLDFLED